MISINKQVTINKGIEEAWDVLGVRFAEAHKWASVITHSEARDSQSFNGSTCSERGCDVSGMGSVKEKLIKYSNEQHSISYNVYEGTPKMIKSLVNTWSLSPAGPDRCIVTMNMKVDTAGFMAAMMKPMMKMQMSKMGSNTVEEFKHYVEHGSPHSRKLKTLKN